MLPWVLGRTWALAGRLANNPRMGFEDRRYKEGGAGAWRSQSSFVDGGFFSWSLPLFKVPDSVRWLGGIRVRVHILYLLMLASEVPKVIRTGDWQYAAAITATLFVMVLLHEFGHCVACRFVGGSADDILMWPLGGLAACRPPHRWRAALVTTAGGPGVNVVLVPVLGAAMLLAGAGWENLIFNPFSSSSVAHVYFAWEPWQIWLSAAYAMNAMLLAFNVLVPMFPMDGGRILQEMLWPKLGYKRSMEIAVTLGLVGAVAMGLYGFANGEMRLVGIAIFGGMTCSNQKQQLKMMEEEPAWAYDTSRGYKAFEVESKPRLTREQRQAFDAARRRQQAVRKTQDAVDRALDKVREQGMQSLSARERKLLEEATARRRGEG